MVTLTFNTAPDTPVTVIGTAVTDTDGSSGATVVTLAAGILTLTMTGSGTPVTEIGTGTTSGNASGTEDVVLGYNGLALAAMGSAVPMLAVTRRTPVLRGTTALPVPRGTEAPVPMPRARPVPAGMGRTVCSP